MIKYFKYYIILLAVSIILPNKWEVIQDSAIWIGVINAEYPECKAEILIDEPIDDILNVIEDVSNYKFFFDSIIISDINDNNEVRLAIDMPFLFADRDYTVKFNKIKDSNSIKYLYKAIISDTYPEEKSYVRLKNSIGGWVLTSLDLHNTKVEYYWNGEMGGNFPEWAYLKAWLKQGNEIMSNLKSEVKKRKNK